MQTRLHPVIALLILLAAAVSGGFIGFFVGLHPALRTTPAETTFNWPLPHHIPKFPGAVTLRFAMVHDVIHERFPRHGQAYYEERNRRARQSLDELKAKRPPDAKPTPEYFALLDDLGVGLDLLGKHEEAVQLMRDKLAEQKGLGMYGRDLYSSYANLGTFLILWQLAEGFGDAAKAKERIRESIELVHLAVEVNPESHFGREAWQTVIEEYLLALLDKPEIVLKYDMIGDRLEATLDPGQARSIGNVNAWHFRAHLEEAAAYLNDPEHGQFSSISELRQYATHVGVEDEHWSAMVTTGYRKPVPFDEPTLGIIGMWRYGGGANPHFALALGEIMLRVGQRYIAWCAYERAAQMAAFVGPDSIAQQFVAHCRRRQEVIEKQLPSEETAALRPRFSDELEHGRRYQRVYQEYEARQIGAGASIDDPHFYDAFIAERGQIASPVGSADVFTTTRQRNGSLIPTGQIALLFAGVFAFVMALVLRWWGVKASAA